MALKKSELYSILWESCDELRGGMDASQYKDYVLVILFVKYISDKYAGKPFAAIKVPAGASFADMVALKGKPDIGEKINTEILGPLAAANQLSDMPDFNDPGKLGSGKERVERLTNLIAIFEKPELDFSKNRADGDDLLGDAYEYLMRHFATESGKSKGQFYTPAEVSRVIAQILGIRNASITNQTSVYDPTCGSGSLLLKVGDEAGHGRKVKVTLYGQEKDSSTAGLARMNMILHDQPGAEIKQGNTLAGPLFKDGDALKTFDYVVANPPFSDKRWSTGLDPENDPFERFKHYGVPPGKQGDYAYLLHIVRSLKSNGKGACILPHGVLFRGNAEAAIRKNLVQRGYIKAIIGLPANLFFGTGIPACIILVDKENAQARKGIFMIDASKGFIKDGNKNRLRDRDMHKIVDTCLRQTDIPGYARMVPHAEISSSKNDFNLNLPRYIDSTEAEDIQDIDGHLRGGIPDRDLDALDAYWQVFPGLRALLFKSAGRKGYCQTTIPVAEIRAAILGHPEFDAFRKTILARFNKWRKANTPHMTGFGKNGRPKALIETLSEDLLQAFQKAPLMDPYGMYQHLMDLWTASMQDDGYLIAEDGWKAQPARIIVKNKKGQEKDKGWVCDLVPKELVVNRYFAKEQAALADQQSALEALETELAALEEEHGGDEGALNGVTGKNDAADERHAAQLALWRSMDAKAHDEYAALLEKAQKLDKAGAKKLNHAADKLHAAAMHVIEKRLAKEPDHEDLRDLRVLTEYIALTERIATAKRAVKAAEEALDGLAYSKYATLGEEDVKTLVVDDKWLAALAAAVQSELDRVSQTLTGRIRQLAERYETTLPKLTDEVVTLAGRVEKHLRKMGFTW